MNKINNLTHLSSIDPHISRSIDVIRGLAALGVIWGHSMYDGTSFPLDINGAFWVWIFLPISGFLVGKGFTSGGYDVGFHGFGRFLLNRFLRIIPLAFIALLIGLFACVLAKQEIPGNAVAQFLFIPKLNDMSLIGPLWTIAAEMQFYIGAVLIVYFLSIYGQIKWKSGGLFLGVFLFVGSVYLGMYWVRHVGDQAIQPRTFLGNIAFFMFGILLARIRVFKIYAAQYV